LTFIVDALRLSFSPMAEASPSYLRPLKAMSEVSDSSGPQKNRGPQTWTPWLIAV
jgi:hypothetical protein